MFRTRVKEQTELALMEHRHAKELFELIDANRAHLRTWMNWVDQRRTVTDVSNYVALGLKQFAINQGIYIGVWEQGKLCGMINCVPIDWPNKSTQIEYWLGAPYQGKGIMTASVRAAVEYAFGTMGLYRLTIRCATENKRSRRIPERLGFAFEGIARHNEWLYDHYVDHAIYSLLKGDKLL
jgi:ribosomal-protein-serine acetyltransferase